MESFSLTGKIETDFKSHAQILELFHHANKFRNCWFKIDLTSLTWIDANQSALLLILINHLKKNNGIKFFIDYQTLRNDLNILSRNGFAYHAVHDKNGFQQYDSRESTVPIKAFKVEDADSFVEYIEGSLLKHRGLEGINSIEKVKVKNSYFEIFDNVGIHSNTSAPVLACGQFYPDAGTLKFTLVDLGDGFLKKISEFTKGNENIVKAKDAITWAVKGGSTKKEARGGTGLKGILSFCMKNGGELHIASDNCYWHFKNKSIDNHEIRKPIRGATIHLVFRFLN